MHVLMNTLRNAGARSDSLVRSVLIACSVSVLVLSLPPAAPSDFLISSADGKLNICYSIEDFMIILCYCKLADRYNCNVVRFTEKYNLAVRSQFKLESLD